MRLFGFTLGRDVVRKQSETEPTLSLPTEALDDGAVTITSNAHYGTYVDLEGSVRNELELITRYREMANHPELDMAIDEITSEAISRDDFGKVVNINLDKLKQPETIKRKICDEFDNIQKLLNFRNLADDLFRRWYIDGRLNYQVVVDEANPREGIKELRYIDPRKIRKVREINRDKDPNTGAMIIKSIAEYYVYSELGTTTQNYTANVNHGIRIAPDSIVNVNSGLMDAKNTFVISYLHMAIKPLNQLRMIEDAMVVYRISRAPERRIFYIDVGNLPKGKAEQYLRDIMIKYKNKVVYDAHTGEVRNNVKHMCLSMDTKVPLLDGRTLTIEEISKEYKEKELWAYSCDPVTGEFSPGLITWAGVSIENAKVMKLTLDNGESVICTPEHKFPIWNKNLVKASDLKVGDSVIPFYTRKKLISPNAKQDYEQIFENKSKEWEFTHRLVSKWKDTVGLDNNFVFNEELIDVLKFNIVHHKNINRFDNSPYNLTRMEMKDHWRYHRSSESKSSVFAGRRSAELGRSQENFAKGRKIFAELMQDGKYNEWFRQQQKNGWTEDKKLDAKERAIKNNLSSRGNLAKQELFKTESHRKLHEKKYKTEYTDDLVNIVKNINTTDLSLKNCLKIANDSANFSEWKELNKNKVGSQKRWDILVKEDLMRIVNLLGFNSWANFKDSKKYKNHKIASIEYLDDTMDVGCLTIDGNEVYHKNHTFALSAGIYVQNSVLEDFWLPRREGGKGTEITTLPGGSNLDKIDDAEFFRKKLLNSLKVPVSRLEPQDGGMIGLGRTTEVTRDEVKFSKFINKLRNKFSRLFDDTLGIQLALKGICTKDEWNDFKENVHYDYVKDNNFTELRDSELLRERLTSLGMVDPYIGKYFSVEWVRKNILQQTTEDMEDINKQIEYESENGITSLSQDQQAIENGTDNTNTEEPVDNVSEADEHESETPGLDSEFNKYSKQLNK